MIIKVKDTYTGKTGTMDDSEMSARYQQVQDTPVVQTQQTTQPSNIQPQSKSIGGFAGNVVKSGISNVGGIGNALLNILNPNLEKNTIANIGRLGIGAGELLIPGEQGSEKYARNVGDFYNQRYGISDIVKGDLKNAGGKIGNTLYNDPVGAALDLSSILSGGAGAVSKIGKLSKIDELANAGNKLSNASRVVDPLQQLSKIINPKIGGVVNKVSTGLENVNETMPTKILKASAPRVTKFEEVLPQGTTINDFIRENGLIGSGNTAFKKADNLVKSAQEQYNALARSKTATINPNDYIKAIDDQIANISSSNYTPGAEKVISELNKTKESFMKGVTENGEINGVPIDKFTNIKTSTVGKANKFDPSSLDAERIAGRAMIDIIDKYAPGSKELGIKLQQLREFRDLSSKVPTGRNTNILGILKPSGTGAALGGLVGGIPGALIGTGAGIASQNPAIMQILGKLSGKSGELLPKMSNNIARGISGLEQKGNIARLLTPSNNENNQNQNNSINNSQVSDIVPPIQQQITQPAQTSNFTPQKLAAALAADPKNSATYQAIYKALNPKSGPKSAAATQVEGKANAGLDAINQIEDMINKDPNIIVKSNIPGSPGARTYSAMVSSLTDAIGGLRTGASVSKEQQAFYKKMLPQPFDSLETIKAKINAVRKELQGYSNANMNDNTNISNPQ